MQSLVVDLVRMSVRLSVCHTLMLCRIRVTQTKMTKSSLSALWRTLLFETLKNLISLVQLHLDRKRLMNKNTRKILNTLFKLLLVNNSKLSTRCRLVPKWTPPWTIITHYMDYTFFESKHESLSEVRPKVQHFIFGIVYIAQTVKVQLIENVFNVTALYWSNRGYMLQIVTETTIEHASTGRYFELTSWNN